MKHIMVVNIYRWHFILALSYLLFLILGENWIVFANDPYARSNSCKGSKQNSAICTFFFSSFIKI